jgi:hypothetical protein
MISFKFIHLPGLVTGVRLVHDVAECGHQVLQGVWGQVAVAYHCIHRLQAQLENKIKSNWF